MGSGGSSEVLSIDDSLQARMATWVGVALSGELVAYPPTFPGLKWLSEGASQNPCPSAGQWRLGGSRG